MWIDYSKRYEHYKIYLLNPVEETLQAWPYGPRFDDQSQSGHYPKLMSKDIVINLRRISSEGPRGSDRKTLLTAVVLAGFPTCI